MEKTKSGLIVGRQAIMDFLDIGSKDMFYDFVKNGMPAKLINKRWYAHVKNLERYFTDITNVQTKDIPEDAK